MIVDFTIGSLGFRDVRRLQPAVRDRIFKRRKAGWRANLRRALHDPSPRPQCEDSEHIGFAIADLSDPTVVVGSAILFDIRTIALAGGVRRIGAKTGLITDDMEEGLAPAFLVQSRVWMRYLLSNDLADDSGPNLRVLELDFPQQRERRWIATENDLSTIPGTLIDVQQIQDPDGSAHLVVQSLRRAP